MDSSEGAVFDATQYDFFGKDVIEEVELGGFEDEEEGLPEGRIDEEEFLFDREEGDVIGPLLDAEDLTGTFAKLNSDVSGQQGASFADHQGTRENSSDAQWSFEKNIPKWYDLQSCYTEGFQEGKWWSSHPTSSLQISETLPLNRTAYSKQQEQQFRNHHDLEFFTKSIKGSDPLCRISSVSEQQQPLQLQHQLSRETNLVPESSLLPYHPACGQSPSESHHSDQMTLNGGGGKHMAISSNYSTASTSPHQFTGLHHGSHIGKNISDFLSSPSVSIQPSKEWVNQPALYSGDNYENLNNLSPHQFSHQNGFGPPNIMQKLWRQPNQNHYPVMPPFGNLSGLQSEMLNSHPSASIPNMSLETVHGRASIEEQRRIPPQRVGQNVHVPQQFSYIRSQGHDYRRSKLWSKYMTVNELEGILRAQLSAKNYSDPYVDDYYHQACLVKKSVGAKMKHNFYPTHLRDLSSQTRVNEPHAFLQVNGLGRVALSSIHRPRPIIDIGPQDSSDIGSTETNISEKPLKKDPMLVVRRKIEDGFCIILDIDDIDRYLKFNQFQDGGYQLRQKRQDMLEMLAASLQLVDSQHKNGHSVGLAAKDEHVFLELMCIPKGKKLITRYLQLLHPSEKLMRIVCMAIFGHLQFFFDSLPSDPAAGKTTNNLAMMVSSCVEGMDLDALSACLAAVVHSLEQPPLRPLGSLAGDGASLIIKSVLDRATVLLTDPHVASNYNMTTRALWQASFDDFFKLLTDYCVKKYDHIIQSFLSQALTTADVLRSDAARAITKEMPIELLRATLPHTDEQHRRTLLDFAHRSMLVV